MVKEKQTKPSIEEVLEFSQRSPEHVTNILYDKYKRNIEDQIKKLTPEVKLLELRVAKIKAQETLGLADEQQRTIFVNTLIDAFIKIDLDEKISVKLRGELFKCRDRYMTDMGIPITSYEARKTQVQADNIKNTING